MPTVAERRANIRKAMEQARRAAIARREGAAAEVRQIFAELASAVREWIAARVAGDGGLPAYRLAEFEAFLEGALTRQRDQWAARLAAGFADVIGMAAPLRPAGAPGDLVVSTLRWINDYAGADGLQLSDRIWRVNQATKETVLDTVRNAVVRGDSARQAAMRMVAEGKAVPADVSVTIRNGLGQIVSDAVSSKLEGDVMRNALRVTRTELNRAYTESFVTSVFEHPDTGGVKFNLSPNHPRPDQCDMHASVNLYGMGKGVYPQGKHPYPAHPETLSYLTVVFTDEITDADRAGKQTQFDWLRRQPGAVRVSVLGMNKAEAFDAGELLESEIFTPWRDVRARLGR